MERYSDEKGLNPIDPLMNVLHESREMAYQNILPPLSFPMKFQQTMKSNVPKRKDHYMPVSPNSISNSVSIE